MAQAQTVFDRFCGSKKSTLAVTCSAMAPITRRSIIATDAKAQAVLATSCGRNSSSLDSAACEIDSIKGWSQNRNLAIDQTIFDTFCVLNSVRPAKVEAMASSSCSSLKFITAKAQARLASSWARAVAPADTLVMNKVESTLSKGSWRFCSQAIAQAVFAMAWKSKSSNSIRCSKAWTSGLYPVRPLSFAMRCSAVERFTTLNSFERLEKSSRISGAPRRRMSRFSLRARRAKRHVI
mmetsp:Transcript_23016/g.53277  ORF Transcript_23016/g.53277 Transcript_23016/m.53277 type:complete len:237 (-) Transcript_23016:10-720(-)